MILTINTVKEFGITNISKYVRYNVDIDKSSNLVDELDSNKNPIFQKEEVFLKVLVEGKSNLYSYQNKGLVRYFFNETLTDIKQLIHKSYLTDTGLVSKNNEFRRQLWNTLKCSGISMDQLTELDYEKSELIDFFIKYNECTGSEFINYQKKQKKGLFNLTLRPGIKSSSLVLEGPVREPFNFDEGLTYFRFGLEAEYILGFNNNKWAIILEPTYQNFESEAVIISNRTTGEESLAKINHESIQVNLGLRHYMFLNKNLKLFANASMVFNNNLNSAVAVTRRNDGAPIFNTEIESGIGLVLGIGCKYKEKYNFELRYIPNRNLLNTKGAWGTEFSSIVLVLGYSLF